MLLAGEIDHADVLDCTLDQAVALLRHLGLPTAVMPCILFWEVPYGRDFGILSLRELNLLDLRRTFDKYYKSNATILGLQCSRTGRPGAGRFLTELFENFSVLFCRCSRHSQAEILPVPRRWAI